MSLSKFGAPVLGNNTDPLKVSKLAQRVEATLQTCLNSEPRQIDPRALLVAPANRDGSSPNVQHIHKGILASFIKNGFDRPTSRRTRPTSRRDSRTTILPR